MSMIYPHYAGEKMSLNANEMNCNICTAGQEDRYAEGSMKYSKYNKMVPTKFGKEESSLCKLCAIKIKKSHIYTTTAHTSQF
jgi:hypothetical protein